MAIAEKLNVLGKDFDQIWNQRIIVSLIRIPIDFFYWRVQNSL